jgi:hypothetical protein
MAKYYTRQFFFEKPCVFKIRFFIIRAICHDDLLAFEDA